MKFEDIRANATAAISSLGGIADKYLSDLNTEQLFRIDFTVPEYIPMVFVLHNYEPEDCFCD